MTIYKTNLENITLFKTGKVRDVYDLGEYLLFVATDRISAFDIVMNQPIPDKGKILTSISEFWFKNTRHIIKNHLVSTDINDFPAMCLQYEDQLAGRSMLVKKANPIMLECVVRGYIAGSGWKEYNEKQAICDIKLPAGLKEFEKLPEPIFTPSTKAEYGHDENINFDEAIKIIGEELAVKLRGYSVALYNFAYSLLLRKGIILADTKFEFGIYDNDVILIDEAITPDSSRFWLSSDYTSGKPPHNFDKQILRDYLESINWNKQPPPPYLPQDIIDKTLTKYNFAFDLIKN